MHITDFMSHLALLPGECLHAAVRVDLQYLLEQVLVVARFDAQQKVHVQLPDQPDVWRVTGQGIFQHHEFHLRMFGPDFLEQPHPGVPLAIVLVVAVLFLDWLGSQWNHLTKLRMHQRRPQHLMLVVTSPVFLLTFSRQLSQWILDDEKKPVPSVQSRWQSS